MANEISLVLKKLDVIKSELEYIKEHMFDPDTIMTIEEAKRFEQSMRELKEGKTTPLSKLKEELGL